MTRSESAAASRAQSVERPEGELRISPGNGAPARVDRQHPLRVVHEGVASSRPRCLVLAPRAEQVRAATAVKLLAHDLPSIEVTADERVGGFSLIWLMGVDRDDAALISNLGERFPGVRIVASGRLLGAALRSELQAAGAHRFVNWPQPIARLRRALMDELSIA